MVFALLMLVALTEKVAFGRAPAISCCASADSTCDVRPQLAVVRASSFSASVSDRSRASHGIAAAASATQN